MLLLALGVLAVFAATILFLTSILGPQSKSSAKATAFECGSPPSGDARQRFAVRFFLVALLFVVFDLEAVFFFPWAVNVRELGWAGFFEMFVFAGTLLLGLAYVWKKGALDWE